MKRLLSAIRLSWVCLLASTLYAATYSGGAGTSASPYEITSAANWQTLMSTSADWSKYFILTADIDLSDITLTPVGTSSVNFTGSFNGNGRIISNAIISTSGTSYAGLFGYIGSGGQVRHLGVTNISVTGYAYVGSLCGYNYGIVNQCYTTGLVTGSSYNVGGLCGQNNGTLSYCYTTATVISNSYYAGGLCGTNFLSISRCYCTGSVTGGKYYVGGLCGYKPAGTISNCFWNTDTAGQTTSAGGTGITTTAMQTLSTFTDAGWDFTNETTNGAYNYWRMCSDGVTYPQLNWQADTGDFACPNGVEIEDLNYLIQWWLTTCTSSNNYCGQTDMNWSGMADMQDVALFAAFWLEGV